VLDPGPLVSLFLISQIIHVCAIIIGLIRKLRSTYGREKEGVKYLAFGFVATLIFISIFNVFLVILFGNANLVSFGMFSFVILEGSIFYAITKHRLLDIRLVVARSISYLILVFVLAVIYIGGLFIFGALILKEATNITQLLPSTFLALVIALSFQTLLKLIEKVTDRVFYKGNYDSNQLLSTLSHIMSTNIETKPLATQTIRALIKYMKVARGALILRSTTNQMEILLEGFTQSLTPLNCQFISKLDKHGIVIFEELEEGDIKQAMRTLGVVLAKALHVNESIVGFLLVGEKASGEMYSDQDLKVIDILAPELAVAIQNAESYDKIKRFNITLTQEVEKATRELKVANTRLEELDQLKDDFVSIASHELRTPMTAIKSYAWMALNKPDITLSEKMKKYLSRTLISTERLINLVNDMLNISRIESGRIEIRPQVFELKTLADEIMSEVAAKAQEKMIHLNLTQEQMPKVFADPDKVHQVLLNLVGNALKFTPADGSITISFFTDGKVVETLVKDSGVGMTKEDQPKLFQKFGRLDNSYVAAATAGGTGLGLYISKKLIELMQGKIWACSEGMGKGSTFVFALPIATTANVAQAAKFTKVARGEAKVLEPVAI